MSVEFLVISLITLAAGPTRGAYASIVAAAGCTLGIVPHMAAAITGLATLLHTTAAGPVGTSIPRRRRITFGSRTRMFGL
jgi:hypothetical protein